MSDIAKGKAEYETGRWSKAYSLFQRVVADSETEGTPRRTVHEVKVLMAHCLLQMGEPDRAESELLDVREQLSEADRELLRRFEATWREMEDTKRLTRAELEARRAKANAEKN